MSAIAAASIFSTLSLQPRDQQAAWREWFHAVFDVMPKQAPEHGFPAENQVFDLDGLMVSRVSAPPVRVLRDRWHLRRDPVDHWVLTYCRRGATVMRTARGSLKVPPGVPFLWSLGEASESARTHVDRVQVFLPRDRFSTIGMRLDAACGTALERPIGLLLGDYLQTLERRLPSLNDADLPALGQALRALVEAAVAPSADSLADARQPVLLGRLERVRQAVRENIHSPDLGPEHLCRLLGMSRSQLYRLLENAGGVGRYIQRERLFAARDALGDPANLQSISAIAERFCFADASSFGRAFRREFGQCPSETRGAAPPVPEATPRNAAQAARDRTAAFADLLRPPYATVPGQDTPAVAWHRRRADWDARYGDGILG